MTDLPYGGRAPVALFIYNRPEHTRRTVEALLRANGAPQTDLIVYSDGPREANDFDRVDAARTVVRAASGFRSVTVRERGYNLGIARNIAEGVSDAIARHGRLIVVEDDVLPASGFLDYMNSALDRYQGDARVWHISGWNYPIDPTGLPPYFFWQVMNCWGWATWADRWAHYRRDPERLLRQWSANQRRAFDLEGAHDFFSQIEDNAAGRLTTWAIFWYATIFEHDGLCLNPSVSFVQNIGFDGTGEHCDAVEAQPLDLATCFSGGLPNEVAANGEAIARIRAHLQRPLYRRLIGRALRRAGLR